MKFHPLHSPLQSPPTTRSPLEEELFSSFRRNQVPSSHLTAELISDPLLPSRLLMFKSSGRVLVFSVLSSQSSEQHVQSVVPSPQAQGENKKRGNLAFAMTILHAQEQKAEPSQAVNGKRHGGSTARKQSQQPSECFLLLQEWIKQHLNNISSFIW